MATAPRVAVVGGGIAGTLCSLVLRNRGLHPRILLQQSDLQVQAPFWQASTNPNFAAVLSMLEQNGLLVEWKGRFGMLGSNKRSFLPSEIVSATVQRNEQDDASEIGWMDSGDYMGFVSNAREKTYVGVPNMSELLPGIWQKAGIEVVPDTRVLAAETVEGAGWRLQTNEKGEIDENDLVYDGLIMASSDPALASTTVRSIATQEQEAAGNDDGQNGQTPPIHHRLIQLADVLQMVSNDKDGASVYAVQATFPEHVQVPFDAVSVHGSDILQFIARESSKPGQENHKENVWTAVSTSQFVQHRAAGDDNNVDQMLGQELARLLSTNDDQHVVPLQLTSQLWRKGAANLQLKENCVTLAPWRLTICGDYLRQEHATPIEATALSGLEAGERVAALFAQ